MRAILHADMDAFYASVEQLDNPAFRGQPVIVGADPKGGFGRGVVAACSYEARRFGVRSALPISRAWKLCPNGVYLRPRMDRYVEVSRTVMAVFRRFTDLVEPLSIDEAFLDITGSVALHGRPEDIGREIKRSVLSETRLTVSTGLGPNKFIAKIASDLKKPDGFVIVREHEVESFLQPLPISRLWGVGPKTEIRLKQLGLHTIGDVAAVSRETLIQDLGNFGEHLFQLSHGRDDRPVAADAEPKSISNETTFEIDTLDEHLLIAAIRELADEVGRRLRAHGLRARKVILKLRYEDFSTHTKQTSLGTPTQSNEELGREAVRLFRQFPLNRKIRLIGVGSSEFVSVKPTESGQLQLFQVDGRAGADEATLDQAVDEIREKFGDSALRRGSQLL